MFTAKAQFNKRILCSCQQGADVSRASFPVLRHELNGVICSASLCYVALEAGDSRVSDWGFRAEKFPLVGDPLGKAG